MSKADAMFPDPRVDANEYLEAHKVKPLFQELGTQMQKLQTAGKPVLFFNEADISTMFEMYDPTGKGDISIKQYNQALLSFGIEHPTVPMTPGRKTMKKAKFQQNVAMEL